MTGSISLKTTLSSLSLENPLILASGIMDEDAGSMKRIIESGAGAVVTKSIGMKERMGHPNPTFVELEHGLLNAMGLPNPGIDAYEDEIKSIKKETCTIIGSIFGSNQDEFKYLAQSMEKYGVDAVELNLSCPHAKGYGLEIGQDPDLIHTITKTVVSSTSLPVFVKVSPNVDNINTLAKAVEKSGAHGIVAINTVKAMKINIEARQPVLANKIGGYSGKAIKPIGIRNVYEIYENVSIPIIGVGGITTGLDVIEYLMAGATAIQVGSAVYYEGITFFSKLQKQVKTWMKEHDIQQITDLIGVAH